MASTAAPRPVRWLPAALALTLLSLLVAHNLHWMRTHLLKAPPLWDQGLYLSLSLRYFHAWQEGGATALLREVQGRGEPQPPFLPLTAVPLYAAFSDSRLAAYASSTLFGALLLAATGLLVRRRTDDWGGLLAMAVTATFSAPMLLARDYQMDLPAAALLTAALLAVERSDGFVRRGPSLAAGALAGLMALTKTMSGPFLVAPALYAASRSWRGPDRRRALAHIAAAGALALALASVWWGPHLRSAVGYLVYYGWGPGSSAHDPIGGGSLFAPQNLGYYVTAFANEGGSVAFLAIAVTLLAVEAVRRFRSTPRPPLDGLMWTWLAAGYVLLSASRNKASDRYVVFVIPPIVVLMTTAVLRQRAAWKRVAIAAMLAAGAANFVAHTWPRSGVRVLKWKPPLVLEAYTPDRTWLRSTLDVPDTGWPVGTVVARLGSARMARHDALRAALVERAQRAAPTPEDQVRQAFRALLRRDPEPYALAVAAQGIRDGSRPLPQEVAALAASTEAELRPLRVLVLPDHPFVNASTFRYHAEWARAPVTFARIEPGQEPPDLEDFDAVVVKTGYLGPAFATRWAAAVEERLRASRFGALPRRYRCPDDSELRVHLLAAGGG